MARKYTKTSPYWTNKAKDAPIQAKSEAEAFPSLNYQWDGSDHYSAIAACGGGSSTSYRDGFAPHITPTDSYKNIDSGLLPWEVSNGHVSISRSIILCQKAYANVAVVRNTIESQVELSTAPLHIQTPNKTVKEFFTEWLNRINIFNLSQQFYREYYRSGNVFLYKFVGKLAEEQYGRMKSVFGAKGDVLPIRYIILNPAQVYLQGGIGFNSNNWSKILSTFEIERLKEPKTPEDKQIFNSLPPATKEQIRNRSGSNNIYMPLDPSRLYYVFYKKQDYEPLAIPMVYPVLNDIEWKLELKKMDMALSRTIEHVILLITNGQPNDQYNKGGMNPQNLANLQAIFRNQTLGRVLVADHTTKGQWLIPDIGAILGPEKYKQVEADIKEGLQSILMGEEKFANAQVKARVFIERMKEGQKVFLNSFLMPEIQNICKIMNFKNVPVVKYEEINLNDPSTMARVIMQMAQYGLLSPEEVFTAVQSGILPDIESNEINQIKFKEARDKGLYNPLVGGAQQEEGRPNGVSTPKSKNNPSPIGTSKASEETYSATELAKLSVKADGLKDLVAASLRKQFKIGKNTELNSAQIMVVESLAKSIIANELAENWTSATIKDYLDAPKEIKGEIASKMNDLAVKYELSDWQAAVLSKLSK